MDKTCAWLETLIAWVERREESPIYFAGTGTSCGNRPAKLLEIVYMKEGCVEGVEMGGARTSVGQGQVAIWNVHFGNVAPAKEDAKRFLAWCVFLDVAGEKRFDVLEKGPVALVSDLRDERRVEGAFGRLMERCRATAWTAERYGMGTSGRTRQVNTAGRALLKASLLELLATLMEEVRGGKGAGVLLAHSAGVAQAVALVHRSYGDKGLDRGRMARAAGLHPDHFGRAFLKEVGASPMKYLAQTRVAQACFLLEHTGQRVEEIAREVGYEDAFHFSRVFKGVTGVSPRGWRSLGNQRPTGRV